MLKDKKIKWSSDLQHDLILTTENALPVVSTEEKLELIDKLLTVNATSWAEHVLVYESIKDTDLASIITRIEQNIAQLKKIKYSLTD